jgi:hypothetical protein
VPASLWVPFKSASCSVKTCLEPSPSSKNVTLASDVERWTR